MESTGFTTKLIVFLSGLSAPSAYAMILAVLLACGLGVPIPEDITLVSAGILAGIGKISVAGAFIAGFVGVLAGDAFLFFLGRKLGRRVFGLPLFRKIFTEKRILIAERKIIENSKFICFTARFLPGLRAPIYLSAGIMGVKPIVFFALDGFAALISVPVWIYVGWFFGNRLDEALELVQQIQVYLLGGIIVVIAGYIVWKKQKAKQPVVSYPNDNQTEKS